MFIWNYSPLYQQAKGRERMSKIILKTNKLNKSFQSGTQEQQVLKNLDIEFYEGDYTVIMGSSGAGKSTLLYALSGMDRPTSGAIRFFDAKIDNLNNDKLAVFRRKNCGFVFQQMFLLDNMSVLDNILASGLLLSGDKKSIVADAKELLQKVGLSEMIWRKFPTQLSGGENQRAAIVRALINKPKVVFADEPTGALNSAAGNAVLDVLTDINNAGQNIIMVTHDLRSARRGNRIIYIKDGVISGECNLGKYVSGDKSRHEKLKSFLSEMGW
jgi:putative ABC transport system ATP-binding protein